MSHRPLACVILAAGKGTRMKSALPKVLHPLGGKPMVNHVVDTALSLSPDKVVVVVGPGMDNVAAAVAPHPTVVQVNQRGTGDAVAAARGELEGFQGDVIVLYGDTPLIRAEVLRAMVTARAEKDAAVVVMGMRPADPGAYGRLVVGADGGLDAIVEFLDATPEQRAITLCNAGFMAFDGARLWTLVDGIGNDNAKGEYYLTDAVAVARSKGWACAVVEGPVEDAIGVNSRAELAGIERIFQDRLRKAAMDNGATLLDPATTYFSADTKLGRDVVVGQNVVFGPGVEVGDNVTIKPFCHFEGVRMAAGAEIGPFARLRPGTVVEEGCHIGNFVELKNTTLGKGSKANHLAYLGDSDIGSGSNIGAGTITCNYDGFLKHRTTIGDGVFVGSNSTLVAPVTLEDGAYVAAATTVTRTVTTNSMAISRVPQEVKEGAAARFRDRKKAEKAAKAAKKG
ncbi:bifunctional UDP-N-acetylglucosamine diphosphorylase/glucosamine-1-phosphate N-acetyltransferase GlmU [Aerophototrophica crusticola]|uniref:Bifunctional protein GlmU n=1 Tax=Aerophototrophica crusticola TaxID=1709002 RepID=A0A858R624_9PROT|nr:bifunctional UDP-N-acetylglucosamine diphosphorylase/glucosamine-1-phosphate N-acetyltransferase GlmU [Rhodospirillaceae bacterium B3]